MTMSAPSTRQRAVIALVRGFVEAIPSGRHRAAGSVTLITGDPAMIVDTGGPEQRQQILDALAANGVDPAAIQYVINTHGHLDHVGNNNLFPQATFILDSDLASNGEYRIHDFRTGTLDIPSNDGGPPVIVMLTPGHTDHDVSVIVRTSNGTVAVVGDLFEYEGDWVDQGWLAWSKDPDMQRTSRKAVQAVADYIVPGHGGMFKVVRGLEV